MRKLQPSDLLPLERYARERPEFRTRIIEHKRARQLQVGPDMTWSFEDRLTMQYQVQEILRAERIFEEAGVIQELEAYNPLIPDGRNFKVTLLIEYPDAVIRREFLAKLKGVEDRCWMRVAGFEPAFAIADEDLERENEEKTSAVHFLRFEFSPEAVQSALAGGALAAGVDHPAYRFSLDPMPDLNRQALIQDFLL
ncbi:MAG: DUF3501 family protein [Steroidobacteraceae bacterium]